MRNTSELWPVRAHGDHLKNRERLLSLLLAADRKRRQTSRTIPPRGKWDGPVPLSYAQERLWFLDQVGLAGAAYNVPLVLRLSGALAEGALEHSFAELVRRHESLRTRFGVRDGVPHQMVDSPRPFELHRLNLSHVIDPQQQEQQLRERMLHEQLHRFDLREGTPWRVVLVKMGAREHALLLTMHHIASDGWSLGVLVRELSTLYTAFVQGRPNPLPDLSVQYADYAIWQRQWLQGEVLEEQLQYWRGQLFGAPSQLQLPTDRPRPAVESFKGATQTFELPATLSGALKELGRREGVTPFMVFLAAYQVLLARWSGQEDIVVGSPIAGRGSRQVEDLIGFFVNTLVLRADLSGHLTFRQLLERVKEVTLGAYVHQDLPFDTLVKELRPDRNLTRQPIFQVMLALQNYPEERLELPGLTWNWINTECATTHFDLTLYLSEASDGLSAMFQYATDLFDAGTIERMAGHFRALLEGVVADPDCLIQQLSLLDEDENKQLLVEWNATEAPYPHTKLIHELFEEQVRRMPGAIAAVYEDQRLTYAELNGRANQLARYLRDRGVGADRLVGICVERGVEMVVGLLGILKAGGAYVPLDPSYPTERLQYMLEDAAPQVVLTQERLRAALPGTQAEVIALDVECNGITGYAEENLPATEPGLTAQNLVYVIYTSGSTGRPKGTAMAHHSMVNLIEWHRKRFGSGEERTVLQFAALGFDVAFQEIFSTLCTGGTLVLLDEWIRRDARALAELLSSRSIARLFVPPLILQTLAECFETTGVAPPESLQDVITAGEPLRISPEISSFFKCLDGCRLHNHYGPTETHVVTALTLTGDPGEWPALPAIGHPISNTRIYILDAQRQPVPIGVVGEIHIGGAGLARGYLGRPELTAERFIADPFRADGQGRLYKTGDLGRWRSDGTIEYLGRNDDQVKIRGYRIELGEIETQLERREQVKEAAVIAREDVAGEKCLVAYVTHRNRGGPSVEELRAHLRMVLPEHMVPSAFVVMESLPLTPNGKLDRRALPAPGVDAYVSRRYEAPQGEVEEMLAGIWQELLQVERVGRHDNFFELGGHSLHGMKLIAKVSERFMVRLSGIAMFQHPTIQQMAAVVESLRSVKEEPLSSEIMEFEANGAETVAPGLESRPRINHAPLAFSQLAHWHLYQLGERRSARIVASAIRLRGDLNVDALRNSFAGIVRRHDALRTRIVVRDGTPIQVIAEASEPDLTVDDLTALPESLREIEVNRLFEKLAFEPIDVVVDSLLAARLLRLGDDEHVLIVAMEHLIADGVSRDILFRELFAAYTQVLKGCTPVLPVLPMQFPEHAVLQRRTLKSWIERHGAYWNEHLKGCQRLRFPADETLQAGSRSGLGLVSLRIGTDLKVELSRWCRLRQTTLVMSVFTAYIALVLRWCNVSEAVIQYQTDGRFSPRIRNTIGYFAFRLYLRIELLENDSFVDLVNRVTEEYCRAYEHADSSYMEAQVPGSEFTGSTCFNWLAQEPRGDHFNLDESDGAITCSRIPLEKQIIERSEIDIEPMIALLETDDEIRGWVQFPLNRFSVDTMEVFGRNFLRFVEALLTQPNERVKDVVLCR